jgi:methionine-gamma-lyase
MDKENTKNLRPETLAVSFGYDPEMGMGAVKPPIFMTSTFVYPSAQYAKDVHEAFFDGNGPLVGGTNHIYARLGHPGLDFLEKRLAAIDGAEGAACFASGMAAHSAIALAFMRPGDSMIHGRPIYGGVDMLYNQILAEFGTHGEAYLDLEWMVRLADEIGERQGHRPIVINDNTFLGPFAQRPIELGVDLCMTSLTKYCAGHSDLLAGGVSGKAELVDKIRFQRTVWGSHLDPFTSWLVLRSLESVALRMDRAMDNARAVAEWLRAHPKVAAVTYLGFLPEGSRQRAVYDRQCKAAGSTFSFHLHGAEAEAFRLLDGLKLMKLAVSLGGSETLICHSATTTHYAVAREQRLAGGITDGTIRLSVGLEHKDDLIADLAQAMEAV